MLVIFHGFVNQASSPVPYGQATEGLFQQPLRATGPTPAYRWYQSYMVVNTREEKAAPSFATALFETRPQQS